MVKKTAKISKKIITTDVDTISPYELASTLNNLKEQIDRWIASYGPDARLNYDRNGSDPYSDSPEFQIQVQREETDEEYEKRIRDEKEWIDSRDKHDRKEFERLQKKFGAK